MVAFFTLSAGLVLYTAEVRAGFDRVSCDPLGTNRSTALRCSGSPRQSAPDFTLFAFLSTSAEEETRMITDLCLDSNCAQRGGRTADHRPPPTWRVIWTSFARGNV
jgi:hypothetical protein